MKNLNSWILIAVALCSLTPSQSHALNLTVIRHGEAQNNIEKVYNSDLLKSELYPLTPEGRWQVEQAAKAMKRDLYARQRPMWIYSSPLRRARETAHLLAQYLGLTEDRVLIDYSLAETGMGNIEGRKIADFADLFPGKNTWDFSLAPFYMGETEIGLSHRMGSFVMRMKAVHAMDVILAVTHGSPMAVMSQYFEPTIPRVTKPGNAEFITWEYQP